MQAAINITGTNPIDLQERKAAIEKILNNASTKELTGLAEFSDNPKARAYLSDPVKKAMLKKFL